MKTDTQGIKLNELLKKAGLTFSSSENPTITGLNYDSRQVRKGDLFFAIKGAHFDGHDFVEEAKAKGALAAVVGTKVKSSLPQIEAPSVVRAMSPLSHEFFGRPSEKIPVIGITGTNGKTTCTYIVEKLFQNAGRRAGVIGTINYRFGQELVPAPNTTPMSLDVHRFLNYLVGEKADALVMEVSSHALELDRVDDVQFGCGVFTNLTQDHLDFHGDMESYFKAKAKLFRNNPKIQPVLNIDDPYGQRLHGELNKGLTFGFESKADIQASNAVIDISGIRFTLRLPSGQTASIKSPMLGKHNISNLLAGIGVGLIQNIPEKDLLEVLQNPIPVPGRLERIEAGQNFVVVVDYAHTPDALEKVLVACKEVQPKRLITVFGAGGDRDRTKRPLMGKAATQHSDYVVLTSDNPRTEDPEKIMKDVERGINEAGGSNYVMIENRQKAIHEAVRSAKKDDLILIAGKGHEDYQIYGTKKYHFSDREVALKEIDEWK